MRKRIPPKMYCFSGSQEVSLGVGENIPVLIQFDPSYKDDFVTRTAESQLEVSFKEHPQKVSKRRFFFNVLVIASKHSFVVTLP